MNVRRAVDMTIQIADAVAEAHAAGFLHGGLSPETVVITAKGNAKIPAFDLAVHSGLRYEDGQARLDDYVSLKKHAARLLTNDPTSTRPERFYEMLTMRRPMHRGASAPSASNAAVSKELDAVVLRAVSPNRDSRYQSVATFAAELRSVGSAERTRRTSRRPRPRRSAASR